MTLLDRRSQTPERPQTSEPAAVPRPPRAAGDDHIPASLAVGLAGAWVILFGVSLAVEPTPDPAATPSALGVLLSTALLLAVMTTALGLALRERWALYASLAGGAVLTTAAATCFLTGHTGSWIGIQAACGLALVGLSRWSLRTF